MELFTKMEMPTDYYLLRGEGDQTGPYSLDQLRAMWASGQVTLDMAYWHEGMTEWRLLREMESNLKPLPPLPVLPPLPKLVPAGEEVPLIKQKGGCAKVAGIGCLVFGVLLGFFVILTSVFPKPNQETSSESGSTNQGTDQTPKAPPTETTHIIVTIGQWYVQGNRKGDVGNQLAIGIYRYAIEHPNSTSVNVEVELQGGTLKDHYGHPIAPPYIMGVIPVESLEEARKYANENTYANENGDAFGTYLQTLTYGQLITD